MSITQPRVTLRAGGKSRKYILLGMNSSVYTASEDIKTVEEIPLNDERRSYDYMDSQSDINARVRASNFSGRLNYLKKNESYITSHSCERKRNILGSIVNILSIDSTATLN
ncbi:hypothetical protein KY285_008642 [Solanum tuberosum]|nr:hypothetical protein KY285_008642 [Solanum tuberosum]